MSTFQGEKNKHIKQLIEAKKIVLKFISTIKSRSKLRIKAKYKGSILLLLSIKKKVMKDIWYCLHSFKVHRKECL